MTLRGMRAGSFRSMLAVAVGGIGAGRRDLRRRGDTQASQLVRRAGHRRALSHRTDDEVDLVLERDDGQVIAIEIKADLRERGLACGLAAG